MIRDTRPQNAIGMSRVDIIVQGRSKHGWQPFNPNNDNGVDGIIIKRKNGVDTGEIIFVQVKCGTGNGYYKVSKNRPKYFGVNVGKEYTETHRPKWNKLFGPAILVYVDYKTEKAWWTDLKNEESYTEENRSLILVPKTQRFGEHSFGNFHKLTGFLHIDPNIKEVYLKPNDVCYFNYSSNSLRAAAKNYYDIWRKIENFKNPTLGKINVTREGWRHISRKGRRPERILQSWNLLGAAKKIIKHVDKPYQLRQIESHKDKLGNYLNIDYISLRAQVIFPHRHSSIVQVILKRTRKFNSTKNLIEENIKFWSVYEPLFGRKIR